MKFRNSSTIVRMLFSSTILLAVLLQCTQSVPVPVPAAGTLDKAEILEIVPVNDQERTEEMIAQLSERNKRTIGMLRQMFPGLSEMIDKKVEEIVQYFVKIIGRAVLQGGLFGGGDDGEARSASGSSGGSSGSSSRRVSITLPTFPPDADDDDDDDDSNASVASSSTTSTTEAAAIQTATADNNDNTLSAAESENNEVRVAFENDSQQNDGQALQDDDQDASASGGNGGPAPIDDIDNVNIDGEDRDKRHFGFGADASALAGGSGGGSGNFLFDIIRNTADKAARAAGTVYRVIAGTESLGVGITATSSHTNTLEPVPQQNGGAKGSFFQQLVAGSGTSEGADEAANGAIGSDAKSVDGSYQEAIPGPITRLFVIANRGISNLVQDLILRLAQTSERIVNFKARLITSLI